MARLCSFTVLGDYLYSPRYESILDLIRKERGRISIDGMVQGGVACDDGYDFVMEPVSSRDEFVVAAEMFESGRLMSIDVAFDIEGETRFYNFNPQYPNALDITLLMNRKVLADGATDFNWHYLYWLPRIQQTILRVSGVEFSDYY